ncbi:DASH complex, subunit Dad4 [Tilletiopsis washingtonensis]|uniref:DASH complex subunit DAD4 n=1 Tax=Tilletiopsis washingtonensis TaxID=58919 RepID=A0A316Z559_9BASI|nr:DASH complex, subunit Dad4 [Tilletiopsis washingtonensis]PWN96098.1 DASH complex, subunit Dad4 [Tilletiopsis washingtonensis]
MENPHEERQSLLLERIIKNVDLLNDALLELDRSVAEINAHNQDITIAAELWEGYRRNVAFNLTNMDEAAAAEAHEAAAAAQQA